jgi:hypothetical protein
VTNVETGALYPGAPVLLICFARGEETGQIKVQDYGEAELSRYRVGQFLPGLIEESPGDAPKIWPEVHQWTATIEEATAIFERYVETAHAAGWRESR